MYVHTSTNSGFDPGRGVDFFLCLHHKRSGASQASNHRMKREAESSLYDNPAQRRKTEKAPMSVDANKENIPTLPSYPSITADTETASESTGPPESYAAAAARDLLAGRDDNYAARRKAMTGGTNHVFITRFTDGESETHLVSINRSLEGAAWSAFNACKDFGYEEDFLLRAEGWFERSQLDEEEPGEGTEALTIAMLVEGEVSGQCLDFDLDTEQFESVPASFSIEVHLVDD